jgi:murein DD-endopeptidase MepM/ murein hydrolase activator NlpD
LYVSSDDSFVLINPQVMKHKIPSLRQIVGSVTPSLSGNMHHLPKATIIATSIFLTFIASPGTQAKAEQGKASFGIIPAIQMLLFESDSLLTRLPCDSETLVWMQPYGDVDHGGGNAFFHDGVDFGNPNGAFFSSADGTIKEVDLDTGQGWPGTNYRIVIQITPTLILDYHFEIGGFTSEDDRKANIFVTAGDKVTAGQHMANLVAVDHNVAHVHWGVYDRGSADNCPLDYFAVDAAESLEELYDSGIEKRPSNRVDLCE